MQGAPISSGIAASENWTPLSLGLVGFSFLASLLSLGIFPYATVLTYWRSFTLVGSVMQAQVKWVEDFRFIGLSNSGHSIVMDGNGGASAPSPMEMVLMAAGGCSSVDVVDGMKKRDKNPWLHRAIVCWASWYRAETVHSSQYPFCRQWWRSGSRDRSARHRWFSREILLSMFNARERCWDDSFVGNPHRVILFLLDVAVCLSIRRVFVYAERGG